VTDIYKENILPRLEKKAIYCKLLEKSAVNSGIDGEVKALIHTATEFAYNRSKLIIKYMPEYTLHDQEHLFKVLSLMEKLIPEDLLDNLNIPELILLILSAFFHDLGMAPSQTDLDIWQGKFNRDDASPEQTEKYKKFERFKSSYSLNNVSNKTNTEQDKNNDLLDSMILVDFIRVNHASNIRSVIASEYPKEIKYKTTDLRGPLIKICESHYLPTKNLLTLDSSFPCGNGEYVCLPFIAAILRLADILDFDTDRTPEVLYNAINVTHPISIEEWKKHLSIQNWDISETHIVFHSVCDHPRIEYAVRNFCDMIDDELDGCRGVLSSINDHIRREELKKYNIKLPLIVDRSKISAKRDLLTDKPVYRYNNIRFVLNKESIIKILMGSSLYGNSVVALRELLQNSIDTCLLRKSICESNGYTYNPKIIVNLDTREKKLIVSDNGMGMNEDDINRYYSNIGTSFYNSREFKEIKLENSINFTSISRFGIGILSCFMISDIINLRTLKFKNIYDTDIPIEVVIEGYDNLFYITHGNQSEPGTMTTLELKENNLWLHINKDEFYKIVKDTLRYPPFEIEILYNGESCTYNNLEVLSLNPREVLLKTGEIWDQSNGGFETYVIDISSEEYGFKGKCEILLLEKGNMPATEVEFVSKNLSIEGVDYNIQNKLRYEIGRIMNSHQNISVNLEGNLFLQNYMSINCESKSSFSIHGIEYPNSLFPAYSSNKKGKLRWPFPMLLVLNYGGSKDLDLNSARDEIIENEKWDEFEENLAYTIFFELKKLKSADYMIELIQTISQIQNRGYTSNFFKGMSRLSSET
jgi:molecular chaperone HtpG